MGKHARPLLRMNTLIFVGGFLIMLWTLFGIIEVGSIISDDAAMGPVVAAVIIILPIFIILGLVYYMAHVKKCEACGKILWWRCGPDEDCRN
ncbi:hypothetical protein [Magnetococcus sp. PR-3]|uniref:hypothetical protein n=1 Tax=Magnetococcus sp. PR-3 TaxID=3120355 RepID=UPI002FCDF807